MNHFHTNAAVDGANTAAWIGAVGTWAVGLVAAWIAFVQYRHLKFRPAVWAFRDQSRRILVRVVNEGAGTGLITDVNLLGPEHLRTGNTEFYRWELEGVVSKQRPVPFSLAGNSSAQLFLVPERNVSFDGLRVRVDYGSGDDSGCKEIIEIDGRLFGSTFISGVTPAPLADMPLARFHGTWPTRRKRRVRAPTNT